MSRGPTERIGRYDVYSEIASGGMAAVFLAREAGSVGPPRTVAIKRLLPHVANEPEFVQMFLDEARLAARIRNPHVVETLDIVSSAGELALVMEYVHGEALSKLLTTASQRGERIDPRVAAAIAVGIFDGLHAAHEARSEQGAPLDIVHRDVSPQNVLVGVDGVARLFDFGIAKAADRLHTTEDGSLKGKIAYMSPEQLETGQVDRRADIWAASVVLWEMLAGRRLFVADSQQALIHVVLTREVPALSALGLPARLDAILARGLARDVNERYATAQEVASDLLSVLAPAPARAVAAWVERNASAELAARARLVQEIEGGSAPTAVTRARFAGAGAGAGAGAAVAVAVAADADDEPTQAPFVDDRPTTAWKDPRTAPSDAAALALERFTTLAVPDDDETMLHKRDLPGGSQVTPTEPMAGDTDVDLDDTRERVPHGGHAPPRGSPSDRTPIHTPSRSPLRAPSHAPARAASHAPARAASHAASHAPMLAASHVSDALPEAMLAPLDPDVPESAHDETRPHPIGSSMLGVRLRAQPELSSGQPMMTPIEPLLVAPPAGRSPRPTRSRSEAASFAVAISLAAAALVLIVVIGVVRRNTAASHEGDEGSGSAPTQVAPVLTPVAMSPPPPVPAAPPSPTPSPSPSLLLAAPPMLPVPSSAVAAPTSAAPASAAPAAPPAKHETGSRRGHSRHPGTRR